jgi:hypothetical protein
MVHPPRLRRHELVAKAGRNGFIRALRPAKNARLKARRPLQKQCDDTTGADDFEFVASAFLSEATTDPSPAGMRQVRDDNARRETIPGKKNPAIRLHLNSKDTATTRPEPMILNL